MQTQEDRRAWIGLAVLALPTLLVTMDMTALFLALPQLSADLGASGTEQLWISDSYGFMVAGFVITMGTLGDRIGRRRLLLVGGAAFAVVSVVAAFAVNPEMMIISRALLGIAGATLMPSTLALISSMFRDAAQRGRAIAVWATCQFAGGALGPVLAGVLLEHFWWGSVFLIAVPAMAVLLIIGPAVLPEFRSPAPGRLDLLSVGMSLVAVLLVVWGLKQVTVDGAHELIAPLGAIAVGVVVGVAFVRRQLSLATPLLDLRLLRNGPLSCVLVALVLAGVAMAGTGLLVTQYLQGVLGIPPVTSALLFAPMGLGVAVGTMSAPALARRVRPTSAIAGGLALSALGSVALTMVNSTSGLPLAILGVTVLALGTGPLFALGTSLVVGSVPADRAGSAASMSETSNYLGGSLGMALIGAVAAAVYRSQMGGAETLASTTAAAGRLPAAAGVELLHAARDAFTSGLNLTGVIAAAIFAGMAALTVQVQRARRRVAEPA